MSRRPRPAARRVATLRLALAVLLSAGAAARPLSAQEAAAPLDSLVAEAHRTHPALRAAQERVTAARSAVSPAGLLPDPMLMLGVMNLPASEPGFGDMMTMKSVGIGQTLPYPGKLGLRRRVAEAEHAAALARLEATRREVVEEVKSAYHAVAFLDRALEVVHRNARLLTDLVAAAEASYGVGTGSQSDVLTARVEASRLAEEAVALTEQRRAALARLNAALSRPSDAPLAGAAIPERVARRAVAADADAIRFSSAALGARVADSPLPPLTELQELAVRHSPAIRAHEAMIAAQAARVELAGRAHLPDFDLSVQYGQRDDRPDLLSATVSIPLPLRRGRREEPLAAAARAELAALQAEHHAKANELRARVARLHAELERERAQLALYVRAILPQGRAALESATASFRVGRAGFRSLLESQATLYSYELAYHRALTDFADRLAELERAVGKELF